MNGIDKIIARIKEDSDAQVAEITSSAAAKRDEILSVYKQQADDLYQSRLAEGRKACEARVDSAERLTRMEGSKAVLNAKQELVAEVFEKVLDRLNSMDSDAKIGFLAGLAAEAATDGKGEVIVSRKDADLKKAVVAKANELLSAAGKPAELTAAAEEGSFSGGVILRTGNIQTNCTTELLVETSKDSAASDVAKVLFG